MFGKMMPLSVNLEKQFQAVLHMPYLVCQTVKTTILGKKISIKLVICDPVVAPTNCFEPSLAHVPVM